MSHSARATARDSGDAMRSDFEALRGIAEHSGQELVGRLHTLVQEHPMACVGAAFGAGIVLSGGFMSRLTMRIALAGGRLYLGRLLAERVGAAFDG